MQHFQRLSRTAWNRAFKSLSTSVIRRGGEKEKRNVEFVSDLLYKKRLTREGKIIIFFWP
jgi:hypothetical protein